MHVYSVVSRHLISYVFFIKGSATEDAPKEKDEEEVELVIVHPIIPYCMWGTFSMGVRP